MPEQSEQRCWQKRKVREEDRQYKKGGRRFEGTRTPTAIFLYMSLGKYLVSIA